MSGTTEKGYRKLRVYQEGHKLAKEIYLVTDSFPKSEMFGLVSQMRRSSVSVVANILEGQARNSKKEFKQFLSIANGSLVELEYYLELSLDLKYIDRNQYDALENQRYVTGSLIGGLMKHLKQIHSVQLDT